MASADEYAPPSSAWSRTRWASSSTPAAAPPPVAAYERGQDRPPERGLDLEHRAAVRNQLHDGPDVIAAARVGRDEVGERIDSARGGVVRACLHRRELPRVRREVAEVAADEV